MQDFQGAYRGMRNFIPMHWIRLTEELMHPDVLKNEIDRAERAELAALNDEDEDDGYDDFEDESEQETTAAPANVQPSP